MLIFFATSLTLRSMDYGRAYLETDTGGGMGKNALWRREVVFRNLFLLYLSRGLLAHLEYFCSFPGQTKSVSHFSDIMFL